ncbi:DUF1697 domain-containing protein [Moraxella ovis]
MSRFVQDLTGLGLYNVSHYINSGNVFFDSNRAVVDLYACIQECLAEKHGWVWILFWCRQMFYMTNGVIYQLFGMMII